MFGCVLPSALCVFSQRRNAKEAQSNDAAAEADDVDAAIPADRFLFSAGGLSCRGRRATETAGRAGLPRRTRRLQGLAGTTNFQSLGATDCRAPECRPIDAG